MSQAKQPKQPKRVHIKIAKDPVPVDPILPRGRNQKNTAHQKLAADYAAYLAGERK